MFDVLEWKGFICCHWACHSSVNIPWQQWCRLSIHTVSHFMGSLSVGCMSLFLLSLCFCSFW